MDRCLKTAVGYGVPLCDAVKSCTLTPARIAGAAARKGSIEAGKDADIVLCDGDVLSYTSRIKAVFIDGRKVV